MLAGQRNFMQVILDLFRIVRMVHGDGGHPDDRIHRSAYVVAHAGEKFLFCRVGLFRFDLSLFSSLARRVHFCIHALQLRYLVSEQPQILKKYAEEHGNYRKRGSVNNGKPAAAHPCNCMIQPVKGENRHQIPIAVRKISTIQMVSGLAVFQDNGIIFVCLHGGC